MFSVGCYVLLCAFSMAFALDERDCFHIHDHNGMIQWNMHFVLTAH
jgi:hypothetical protein